MVILIPRSELAFCPLQTLTQIMFLLNIPSDPLCKAQTNLLTYFNMAVAVKAVYTACIIETRHQPMFSCQTSFLSLPFFFN